MPKKIKLDEMNANLGKRTRLHRMLYEHGPGEGRLLILPIDHGVEHGPVDFSPIRRAMTPITSAVWPSRAAIPGLRSISAWRRNTCPPMQAMSL